MKMTSVKFQLGKTLSCLAVPFFLAGAMSAHAGEYRLGVLSPPQHFFTKAAERFSEAVEERSGGDIKVIIYPSGQLGDENAMFSQVETGLLDMGIFTVASASQRSPSLVGWFTPFLFNSVAEAASAIETDSAKLMLGELEEQGLHTFGYTFAGMRHILMRSNLIDNIDDLENQKVRITPIPAMQAWWRATGATPVPVSLPDVYQGLQSGMLDGVDVDLDALVGSGFYEVANNLTLTNHMAFPAVSVISEATWSSLSEAERDLFEDAMQEALTWATNAQIEAEANNLTYLEESIEMLTLSD